MEQNERVSTRLSATERHQIEQLVEAGKFQNISQVIRTALSKFLSESQRAS
jgi:Arc/MetJ-type ribon-helix-helix transcriptional regulator